MTDLVPLLQQDLPAGAHALLDSAGDDAPRAGSRDVLLSKLGVGTALLGAAATSVTAGSASALSGGASKALSGGFATIVAKWLGLGAVVGTLASSAVVGLSSRDVTERPIAVATRTVAVPAPPPDQFQRRAERLSEAPAAPAPPSSRTSTAGTVPPPPATNQDRTSRMAAELVPLDQARVFLGRGKPSVALELLTQYEREFPDGALRPEATLLRMDALRAAGNDAAAAALARRFLDDHGASPHAERVRALLQRIEGARPATNVPAGAGQKQHATDSGVNGNVGRFPATSNP